MSSASYRRDIDGLRTLAVVPVVLFHAGTPYITGGFVGVDVFFVISGFLITGIIAREIGEGRFSILEFYRRRARRIFPALTLVGFVTLLIGYLALTPREFENLGKSAATVTIFASNFYFWRSVSYFDPGIQPLLHTWSLAVEEQYYLFFPILLIAFRRRSSWIAPALWAVFTSSFVLSIFIVSKAPSAAFYLLPTRAWELMLGGLLALNQFGAPRQELHARLASVLGMFLILVPVFVYTPATLFPGAAAAPPSVGAALLIWGRGWGLSSRPMVAIGLVSYSFYLWHLPVIDFAKYLTDAPLGVGGGLLATAVSLGLAGLTYRFVEQPFRVGRNKRWSTAAAAAGMPVLAAAALAVVFWNGFPSRLSPLQARQLSVMDDRMLHPSDCMSLDQKWVDPAQPCSFGHNPSVLLWGDSHSMVTASSLLAAKVPFLFAADADCPIGKDLSIAPDHERALVSQGHYVRCGDFNRAMLERALEPDVRTVVLSSRWTNWRIGEPANPTETPVDVRLQDLDGVAQSGADNRTKFERAFTALVDQLSAAGKKVVIVGPLPEPSYNVPHRLYVSGFGFSPPPAPVTDYARRHRVILEFFARFEGRKDVTMVWPATILCQNAVCPMVRGEMPVFFDHNHLTVDSARRLAPLYRFLGLKQ